MKKAYEWREEQIKRGLKGDILSMEMDLELIPFFKEIQRDAMNHISSKVYQVMACEMVELEKIEAVESAINTEIESL